LHRDLRPVRSADLRSGSMSWRPAIRWHRDAERPVDTETATSLAARLEAAAQTRLGRSLAIRHLDAGSCGGCEIELSALNRAVFDLQQYGLRFVDSPRHADVLLVTGPLTRNL